VPVIIMKKMSTWRCRQAAQPIAASPTSSAISRPTHTARQSLEVKRSGRVEMRIPIQVASARQHAVMNSRPNRLRSLRRRVAIGCGRSMAASMRASSRRSSWVIVRSSASSITLPFCAQAGADAGARKLAK